MRSGRLYHDMIFYLAVVNNRHINARWRQSKAGKSCAVKYRLRCAALRKATTFSALAHAIEKDDHVVI